MVVLNKRGHCLEEAKELQCLAEHIESETHADHQGVVPDELIDPHPLVEKSTKSLRGARAGDYGMVRPRAKCCLDNRVGKESIERASCIVDALTEAMDARTYMY